MSRLHNGSRRPARSSPIRRCAIGAGTALALARPSPGCGGSSPTNTTGKSASSGGIAASAFRFVACMRTHGYPNTPDPQVSTSSNGGTIIRIRAVQHTGPKHPPAIPKPCRGIMPNPQNASPQQQAAQDAARRAGLLSFAACMRTHGVKSFPDPTSQGQLTIEMIDAANIDLHTPPTLAAIKACIGASHGVVTPQAVAQALAQTRRRRRQPADRSSSSSAALNSSPPAGDRRRRPGAADGGPRRPRAAARRGGRSARRRSPRTRGSSRRSRSALERRRSGTACSDGSASQVSGSRISLRPRAIAIS